MWDRVSVSIFKTFLKGDVNMHYAMKIFLMHDQGSLTNPILMSHAYQALQKMDVPEDCTEIHEDFVVNFPRLTVDQLNQQVEDLVRDFKDYGAGVAEIMSSFN